LDGVVAAMRSSIGITRAKALSQGIRVNPSNPGGGTAQNINVVDMEGFSVEVDWRNLCPESRSEINEVRSMLDFILMEENTWNTATSVFDGELYNLTDNQYTYVGYDIRESGPGGCYVRYDSFGDPMCTVDLIITDC
jgi:MSHA pilin protein MshA